MYLETGDIDNFLDLRKRSPLHMETSKLWDLANIYWESRQFNSAAFLFSKFLMLSRYAIQIGANISTSCGCPLHELVLSNLIKVESLNNHPELAEMHYQELEDYYIVKGVNISDMCFNTMLTTDSALASFDHCILFSS